VGVRNVDRVVRVRAAVLLCLATRITAGRHGAGDGYGGMQMGYTVLLRMMVEKGMLGTGSVGELAGRRGVMPVDVCWARAGRHGDGDGVFGGATS
jgi:hypothetical protein